MTNASAEFDAYAKNYEAALQQGLKVSGEDSSFFAEHRIEATEKALATLAPQCQRGKAIDFGCGTGNAVELLRGTLGFKTVLGLDVSSESLAVARRRFDSPEVEFQTIDSYSPVADADLIFCNGVFHHIPPTSRPESLGYIHRSLKPGGIFVLWENNPWNPGVHYIMRAIPFDRDARMLFSHRAVKLLRRSRFDVLQLRFFFVFPKPLARMRALEPRLSRFPFGAQYQIIARKERI